MSTIYNPFSPESVAVSRLTAMGFEGRRLGEFDAEPESLVYIRQLKVDIRGLVRVVGPDECEAIRMVGSAVALQTYGSVAEVVARMALTWPEMPTGRAVVSA
jgi:hypothetical protein